MVYTYPKQEFPYNEAGSNTGKQTSFWFSHWDPPLGGIRHGLFFVKPMRVWTAMPSTDLLDEPPMKGGGSIKRCPNNNQVRPSHSFFFSALSF